MFGLQRRQAEDSADTNGWRFHLPIHHVWLGDLLGKAERREAALHGFHSQRRQLAPCLCCVRCRQLPARLPFE